MERGRAGGRVSKNGFVGRAPNNSKMTTPLREGWHAPSFSSASNARPQTGFDIFLSLSVGSARLFGVSLAQRACSVCSVAAENADWIPREKIKPTRNSFGTAVSWVNFPRQDSPSPRGDLRRPSSLAWLLFQLERAPVASERTRREGVAAGSGVRRGQRSAQDEQAEPGPEG